MKRIFTWQFALIGFILTVITYSLVNGPTVGTGHLQSIVPGVTIPDLTRNYSSDQLPDFFQVMGDKGRAAYVVLNNFDFLFIASNVLFGVSTLGFLLVYIMRNKALAAKLAFIGLLPGFFDALESVCFRLIVLSPYADHTVASEIAAAATKAKFVSYNLALLLIFGLAIVAIILLAKRRRETKRNI